MAEFPREKSIEGAKKIADAIDKGIFTLEDLIAGIPQLVAFIYSRNPVEHLAFYFDVAKDESLIVHSKLNLARKREEMEKL